MKFFQRIFYILLVIIPCAFADDAQEYKDSLEAVNARLSVFESTTSFCPGVQLALSCGDLVCEKEKGEDEKTCAKDCSTALISSSNSQTFCEEVKEVLRPTTSEEVQEIVVKALAKNRRVRVVGSSHSSNSQLCTDGVVVSTEKLNRILGIEIFEGKETVLVEPGVTQGNLANWLHSRGKSLGYGLVEFRGITVAGMAATGAHGSSPKHSAIFAAGVQSMLVVTANGNIIEYSENTTDPELFKALRTHMGMIGVVVQMRIKIRSQFNLDTTINFESESAILAGKGALELVKNCDFGVIHWFVSTQKIMKTCGIESNKVAHKDAENIYLNPYVPTGLIVPSKVAFHYGACSNGFNALLENLRFTSLKWQPPLIKRNSYGDLVNSTHVIGPSHRMLSSELGLAAKNFVFRDWEVAIPQNHLNDALKTIKRRGLTEKNLSLPVTGVHIRFTPVESSTLVSNAVQDKYFKAGEIAAFIEFLSYYPVGFSPDDRENYSLLYQQLLPILIEQFHGRPHWGKNNEAIFKIHKNIGNEQHLIDRFKKWVNTLDPNGVFSNDFGDLITG